MVAMESLENDLVPRRALQQSLLAARREINGRLLVQRVARGMGIGLIVCFPVLVLMLCYSLSGHEMAAIMGVVTGVAIVGVALRGPWAADIDAAVYLENQFNRPGLFITAAELLEPQGTDRKQSSVDMAVLVGAGNVCCGKQVRGGKVPGMTTVVTRLWPVNGLLLLGLLITAVVGRAILARPGQEVAMKTAAALAVSAETRTNVAGEVTELANHISKSNLSARRYKAETLRKAAERPAQRVAQRQVIKDIKQIQISIRQLLKKDKQHVIGTAQSGNSTAHGGSGSSGKDQVKHLEAQLLAAAILPAVDRKAEAMFIAAAQGIHASRQGHFAPRLHRINQRLETYLASITARKTVGRLSFESNGDRSGMGNNQLIKKSIADGDKNRVERTGDSTEGIVADIPSGKNVSAAMPLQWGYANAVHAAAIPTQYRNIIRRYFSNSRIH